MRGGIRNRGLDTWQVRYEAPRVNGERQYRSETVHGKKARAQEVLRERLREIDRGAYIEPDKATFAEFGVRWADYAGTRVRARTLEGYQGINARYLVPAFGSVGLQALRPDHVRALHAAMLKSGLSALTVCHAHRLLHKMLADALSWGLVVRNVADGVVPPRPIKKEMQTLDWGGVERLLAAVEGTLMYALFYLAIFTGLRRSELLGLRWGDVDLENGSLSVVQTLHQLDDETLVIEQPKTAKSRRRVALSPDTVKVLRAHRIDQATPKGGRLVKIMEPHLPKRAGFGPERLVFSHNDGSPLLPNSVSTQLVRVAARLGIKLRLHDLRHTHATLSLLLGEHPKIVQERLGHSSIAITLDTYSHVTPGLQEAAALRFDKGLADFKAARDNVG